MAILLTHQRLLEARLSLRFEILFGGDCRCVAICGVCECSCAVSDRQSQQSLRTEIFSGINGESVSNSSRSKQLPRKGGCHDSQKF